MTRAPRLLAILGAFRPADEAEARDAARVLVLVASGADPWARDSPLHVTGSALVVHPPTRRVLLRWHDRMGSWLQVGGHGDPGEDDPFAVARREAVEETGLTDLVAWPDAAAPRPLQIVVVPVPPGKGEPAHEHADVRYVLATNDPDAIAPEHDSAPLAWLSLDEALDKVAEENLRVCLERLGTLL
jgi:8-oxo-dGTP pyrophosphatase MutT (NUDIX family)